MSKAQLVVDNGLGYDDFMDKLFAASPNSSRKVITAVRRHGHLRGRRQPAHLVRHRQGSRRRQRDRRPAGRASTPPTPRAFTANAKTFDDSLAPIAAAIADIKSKFAGAPIGYTERVPGYLVDAAGLEAGHPGVVRPIHRGRQRSQPRRTTPPWTAP